MLTSTPMARKGEIPLSDLQLITGLRTGEPIPAGIEPITTQTLMASSEKERVFRIPRAFEEIQNRLLAHSGTIINDDLATLLGADHLSFVEPLDTRSQSHVFLGYERNGFVKEPAHASPQSAVTVIELTRDTGSGQFSGIPHHSDRLQPSGIKMTWVDTETGRIFAIRYDAKYQTVQSHVDRDFIVRLPHPDFVLHEGYISASVSEDTMYQFEHDITKNRAPNPDYHPGNITVGMVSKAEHLTSKKQDCMLSFSVSEIPHEPANFRCYFGTGNDFHKANDLRIHEISGRIFLFQKASWLKNLPLRLTKAI